MTDMNKRGSDTQGVRCDVNNCKYNTTDCKCTAGSIKVKNEKAVTKGETFCETFCQRGSC